MSERTELEFWIVASRAEGVGLKTLVRIHSVNQLTGRTMADFFGLNSGKIERDYGLSSRQVDSLRKKASEIPTIREELDGLLNRDIAIVTLSSESYPLSIRRTLGENAPPILYALGDLSLTNLPGVAVVGSRHVAQRAIRIAEEFAALLAREGINIVAGYAPGVDTAAHRGALRDGGATTLVLPFGLSHFTWKMELERFVREGHYLVISSYPPRRRWTARAAMERNALISALSRAVVLVAAREDGGAVNEALTAFKQGRKVFAVEYTQYDETNLGNRHLLKMGASPIRYSRSDSKPNLHAIIASARGELEPANEKSIGVRVQLPVSAEEPHERVIVSSELRTGIFDNVERSQVGPARYAQPHFDYLNRSARARVGAVRDLLEKWFEDYPREHGLELRNRFRSPDNRQHLAAFLELYLFTLFSRLGWDVEVHPQLKGSDKRPDFRLSTKEFTCYLESTLAAPSDEQVAQLKREARVYDVIDRMNSPNFFLGVEVVGYPASDPPAAKMREFLEQELRRLDPDLLLAQFDEGGLEALPRWRFQHGDWEIEFWPIPKSRDSRGTPGVRPIGLREFGPEQLDSSEGIAKAVRDKAAKYGELEAAYIVAVNVIDEFVDDIDLADALFGQEQVIVTSLGNGSSRVQHTRRPNGVWVGPSGPQNTRLSGVLTMTNFSDWHVADQTPMMWLNPWANKPFPPALWKFTRVVASRNRIKVVKSRKSPARLLQLPPGWPSI